MSKISELSDGGSLVSTDFLIAVRSGGNVKVQMDTINVDQVDLGDNEFIRLGNSQDLTLVHTSTQSIINQAGVGDLLLQKAGATKLTINASGIDVTGSVTASGTLNFGTLWGASSPIINLRENGNSKIQLGTSAGYGVRVAAPSDATDAFSVGTLSIIDGTTYSELFKVSSAGNVGIGIAPAHKLSVFGTGVGNATVQIEGEGGADPYINFLTNNAQHWSLGVDDSDADKFKLSEHSALGTNDYFVVDVTGNVGVGTASPKGKINSDVGNTSTVGAFSSSGLNITSTSGAANNIYQIGFGYASGATNAPASIYALTTSNAGFNNNAICFATRDVTTDTAPTVRMRINSDGKVDVGGVANQTTAVLNARFSGAALEFGHGNNGAGYYGTAGSYGNNGQPYIGFSCYSQENVNVFTTTGVKGNIITGDLSGNLTFAQVTTASATGQTPVNRMMLDTSGNLLVGKTATGTGAVGFEVQQDGEVYSIIGNGYNTYHVYANSAYRFYVNPNGGIYNYSANNVNLSDEREKKNIEALESQWDSLKQWSLKKFHYNADNDSDNKKLGVIAQEVESYNPEVISEFKVDNDTTRLAVKEQQMMWMAIKALQEAQTRIESLEARIAALES